MSMIGSLPRFNGECDDWQVFTERLQQFFEINDVVEEKKRALLITSIADNVYKTLRDVCHPVSPTEKSFAELCTLLGSHYVLKTSVFRERYKFYNAKQKGNESIANWFARLKRLSVNCKFGDNFDGILLDRFISGLGQARVLNRLCDEDAETLTLQEAIDIASRRESLANDVHGDGDDEGGGGSRRNRNRRK